MNRFVFLALLYLSPASAFFWDANHPSGINDTIDGLIYALKNENCKKIIELGNPFRLAEMTEAEKNTACKKFFSDKKI
ncbi:MAG: hypothetical protein HOG41_15730 [Gammaproteobacteria bacterium]|jgi:hypothetical protein|nr:hypothetical protein [Gammaproteobacteria bacterium]